MADPTLSQQVDQWKTWLNTITSNLLDLSAAESTKAIRARLADPAHDFSGITKEKAARGITTLDTVVDLYGRLTHVIDDASALVNKRDTLRIDEERARALLDGQSIVLQEQPVAVRDRGLLEDEYPEARMTPAQALAQMERSFAEARDAITAVADAMDHVQPRLAALNQEIARLDGLAETLGIARPAALADVSPPIARVESDPLGCATELAPIEDAVARWRIELKAIDADHKAVFASLERGRVALTELRNLIARSGAALKEAREKIADPEGLTPPAGDEVVSLLDSWLRTLDQHAASGRFAAVKVGLAKWEQACNGHLEAERASYARNSAGLDERTELRGRYRALCAKAVALQRRGVAIGEAAEAACRQGKSVLDAIPFDLRAGRRMVETLEAALSTARR
jgi:predicted  nucleic acid-binding Zn-ribbon protein